MNSVSEAPHRAPAYTGGASSSASSGGARHVSHATHLQESRASSATLGRPSGDLLDRKTGAGARSAPSDPIAVQISRLSRADEPQYPSAALALRHTRSPDPSAVYIEWKEGDPENPVNWPNAKKWSICLTCFMYAWITGANAAGYNTASRGVQADLHTTSIIFNSGSFTYLMAVAFTPMVLAPLSEVYGRRIIFLSACALFVVTYIPQALAPNATAIVVTRIFQGAVSSVGNSVIGGTVADVFQASDRGFPLSVFALFIFVGQALGPLAGAWTSQTVGWRWIFWSQAIASLIIFVMFATILRETRGPVLLSRRAARLTRETGILHRCDADDEKTSLVLMAKKSLTRPFVYLFTEPIVAAFSVWVGFAWACIFLLFSSIPIVFEQYGWSEGERGLVFLVGAVGAFIGWCFNLHQDRIYAQATIKHGGKARPESRLHWVCVGGVLFPVGLFIYAWGGQPSVHPAVPIIGLVILNAGVFPIYVAIFSYMADCYERYSSSAIAAQSFLRNFLAALFPLFGVRMYHAIPTTYASTILGCVAALLGIVPFVVIRWGATIRKRSRVARELEQEMAVAAAAAAHSRWERGGESKEDWKEGHEPEKIV